MLPSSRATVKKENVICRMLLVHRSRLGCAAAAVYPVEAAEGRVGGRDIEGN